jgi:hypothetical protein
MYSGYGAYDRPLAKRQVTQVSDPNTAWYAQEAHWILIEDLMGGTYGMRKKHRRYLPQEPRELDESYDNRLARSVVAPYYQRLERMLAGMLTRKPVRLEDTSDVITEQLFNVDMQNNDLNVWTYETARKLVRYGHVGTLVDAPQDGGRPYWVTYTPRQILGWRSEPKDGQQVLSMLRLSETVTIPDGEYGEKVVQQIRLLTPGGYQLHQKGDDGEFRITDEGTTSLSEIPFSVAYSNRVSYLESRPPLEDIAELNLKQYQVQSDLDNILHISRAVVSPCWHSLVSHQQRKRYQQAPVKLLHFQPKAALSTSNQAAAASTISFAGWSKSHHKSTSWAYRQC